MAVILITHDLGVVVDVADTVCVMYGGRVVEYGKVAEVMRTPAHPYTKALIDSAPQAQQKGKRLKPILGSPRLPSGCTFHPRCANATDICRTQAPVPSTPVDGRMSECHHAESVYHASVNT